MSSPSDKDLRGDVELSVPGLKQLLIKASVNKSYWPAIQEWCDQHGAQEIEDILVNLNLIAVSAQFRKCVAQRIKRHAQ